MLPVGGTETQPGSDVRGWSEMVGEVARCLTVQTTIHHDVSVFEADESAMTARVLDANTVYSRSFTLV